VPALAKGSRAIHKHTQIDWAVLCVRATNAPRSLCFGEGTSDQVDELAGEADSQYLQVISGNGKISYSRMVTVLPATSLGKRVRLRGVPKRRAVDHWNRERLGIGLEGNA